ncbi:hypothetical protein [Chryseobacterium lathyri]|jgi:hypothetical protein|uniref:hypothetical protein n=1 Tax=Chryseobacterium lathyri TaxID=395933 RepID=UPI001CBB0767|nr:hypothetical protein [Chryseobacterium lathyri]
MNKKIVSFIFFTCSHLIFSQVGINTDIPSATLDIVSKGSSYATKALEVNNSSSQELLTVLDNGNVGIGIQNPSAQLHTTGTVRMEGLGINTNNTRVMTADTAGNITTRSTSTLLPQVLAGANGLDAINAAQTISSINNVPTYTNGLLIKSFTLSQPSIVTFYYSLGTMDLMSSSGSSVFNDGAAKQIGTNLIWKTVPAGSSFPVNSILCTSALPFSNIGDNYVSGTFYLSNSCSLLLPAGAYSVELQGFVNASDNNLGIRATFGSNSYDRFDITATSAQ